MSVFIGGDLRVFLVCHWAQNWMVSMDNREPLILILWILGSLLWRISWSSQFLWIISITKSSSWLFLTNCSKFLITSLSRVTSCVYSSDSLSSLSKSLEDRTFLIRIAWLLMSFHWTIRLSFPLIYTRILYLYFIFWYLYFDSLVYLSL